MRTLEKLTIKNFKSIREQTLALGKLNVFIGGNGAGKSRSMFPAYKKTLHGPTVAALIGLEQIRMECPHFDEWLTKLEKFADE
jgi:hypothetical protein